MKPHLKMKNFGPLLFGSRLVSQYIYFIQTAFSHSHSVHLPNYSTLHHSLPSGQIKRTKDYGRTNLLKSKGEVPQHN